MPVIALPPLRLPEATSADQIADYFMAFANATGSLITNMKLQKLVFYTQAWHIAVFNQEIFEEDFQAWIHGPVVPSLYERYKSFQWRPIIRDDLNEGSLRTLENAFSTSMQEILADIIIEYFYKDAFALEQSTHSEAPWRIARGGVAADEPSTNVIDKKTIHDYYSQFVKSDGQEFQSSQGL
ncbi:Uncharacterized phage-associated protein [Dyadobacter soli]|uniref:Uncharacterized phage-associated protein n=2 Tax=Dyadobacter soli TaxID=659014 RepID=A0A1G6XDE9_9BACT|nr:Uncharacterized phage-associated protein [Dyadobacter soli]